MTVAMPLSDSSLNASAFPDCAAYLGPLCDELRAMFAIETARKTFCGRREHRYRRRWQCCRTCRWQATWSHGARYRSVVGWSGGRNVGPPVVRDVGAIGGIPNGNIGAKSWSWVSEIGVGNTYVYTALMRANCARIG